MSGPEGVYGPNRQDVISKVADGEAILIRISDGAYCSLDHIGAIVWENIESCVPMETVCAAIAEAFAVPLATVQRDVGDLLKHLENEKLISRGAEPTASSPPASLTLDTTKPYESPVLSMYRDMGGELTQHLHAPGK